MLMMGFVLCVVVVGMVKMNKVYMSMDLSCGRVYGGMGFEMSVMPPSVMTHATHHHIHHHNSHHHLHTHHHHHHHHLLISITSPNHTPLPLSLINMVVERKIGISGIRAKRHRTTLLSSHNSQRFLVVTGVCVCDGCVCVHVYVCM